MSDPLQARNLLDAASRDLGALTGMGDAKLFADEIFGFHVQQVIEKSLKGWLATLGEIYPYTHDLSLLLGRLEDLNCDIAEYQDLVSYTVFAGQVRYVGISNDANPIERERTTARVRDLYNRVEEIWRSHQKSA